MTLNKKIKNSVLILLAFLFVCSCTTKDDYEIPEGAVATTFIIHSIVEAPDRSLKARVGFIETFIDATSGSNFREWIFPEGSVEYLEGSETSKEVRVKFLKQGDLDITLKSGGTDSSIQINVLSKVKGTRNFKFEVLSPSTADSFMFDEEKQAFIIEAGTQIKFTETTEAGLEDFEWEAPGQTPKFSEEPEVIITFKKVGTTEKGFRFRASSSLPFADIKYPFFEGKEPTFIKVIVIASSLPLIVNPIIRENAINDLVVTYSRELNPTTIPPLDNFSLIVDGQNTAITAVKINPENASEILITPSKNISSSQEVKISVIPGDLQSSDGAKAPEITDGKVQAFYPDLSFENNMITFENIIGETGNSSVNVVSPGNNSNNALEISNLVKGNSFEMVTSSFLDVKKDSKLRVTFDYKLPSTLTNTTMTIRFFEEDKWSDANKLFIGTCCGITADDNWQTYSGEMTGVFDRDFKTGIYWQVIGDSTTPENILIDNIIVETVE